MRPNNLPHLEATAEESALLRGAGAAGFPEMLQGDDGRGHRKHRDPNIPRTPSPVYQYEKNNPYSEHSAVYAQGGRGGAAIPEDRPVGAFGALTGKGASAPSHAPPPHGPPPHAPAQHAGGEWPSSMPPPMYWPHMAAASGYPQLAGAQAGAMNYGDYYNMMLNPMAVQQAAAAAAATVQLQQSMKSMGIHDPGSLGALNPLLYGQGGDLYGTGLGEKGGKGKGGGPKGGAAAGGKGSGKGGKDDRKKRKETRRERSQMPQPAEDLNAALNQPIPEGCSEQLRLLRRQGDQCQLTLRDLDAATVEFAMDQYGSRFLQQCLEDATDEDKNLVFMRLLPEAARLTTDAFGNYVIQKLLENGSSEIKRVFAEQLVGDVMRLAMHMYGCRVVQKVLEEVSTDQQVLLVAEMKGQVIKCIEDQNGNHVVQKCIERLPPERVQFIVDELRSAVDRMALHCYGCRVVQRVLEHCLPHQTSPILDDLLAALLPLCRDQYGNYVVQHVLEHGRPVDRARIIEMVKHMPLELSCHKFASNVVEKGLLLGNVHERTVIINAIIGEPREPQRLQMMVRDRFANYVVQRLLDVADPAQKEEVFWILKDQVVNLKKTSYGKHILSKLEQIASTLAPSAVAGFGQFSLQG